MIAGLILAAGESSRMGSPKPLLDWHGRPLVRYQVEQLRDAGCGLVVVVLGFAADRVRCFIDERQAMVIVNAGYLEGRASSVRAGVAALPASTSWVAVLGVDQPRPAAVPRALIESSHTATATANIIIPTHNGRRGHPTLFAGRLLPELARVQEATLGLRDVVVRHQASVQEVPLDDPAVLLDLNTQQDYAQARRDR